MESRLTVEREWRGVKRSVRETTGWTADTANWALVLAGVGVGLELARRWLRSSPTKRDA